LPEKSPKTAIVSPSDFGQIKSKTCLFKRPNESCITATDCPSRFSDLPPALTTYKSEKMAKQAGRLAGSSINDVFQERRVNGGIYQQKNDLLCKPYTPYIKKDDKGRRGQKIFNS
jgi:hypothetical protein